MLSFREGDQCYGNKDLKTEVSSCKSVFFFDCGCCEWCLRSVLKSSKGARYSVFDGLYLQKWYLYRKTRLSQRWWKSLRSMAVRSSVMFRLVYRTPPARSTSNTVHLQSGDSIHRDTMRLVEIDAQSISRIINMPSQSNSWYYPSPTQLSFTLYSCPHPRILYSHRSTKATYHLSSPPVINCKLPSQREEPGQHSTY